MENRKLIQLIEERIDPDELIDILGLEIGELCLRLRDVIIMSKDKFEFLDQYDYGSMDDEF